MAKLKFFPSLPPRALRPRYWLEAVPVFLFYGLCALLPLDAASALGGLLGRTIGPLMGVSRRAERNLRLALPELDASQRRQIIKGMWDNLGRVGSEYPHLHRLMAMGRITGTGQELFAAMQAQGKGGIIVGGHLANWEIGPIAAVALGMPLAVLYRAPNNPWVDWLIRRARRKIAALTLPKGAEGAINLLRHLRGGGFAGILIDQKQNDGLAVPFFGHDAYTTPAPAELALRYQCPVAIARIERLRGAHFRMVLEPVEIPRDGERSAIVAQVTASMTRRLEDWIRQRPAEWLWLHNRWPRT
jgi:Kdo2-lipid IVA lauroyltransferase/acyltransferase